MSSFGAFILTYLLGGLTFIPLVLIAVVCHGYITFPIRKGDTASPVEETRTEPGALDASKLELAALPSEVNAREHEPDVAAGFFAVCREFIPGGISGKPPERGAPAGSATGVESPSVYQNMYRSIFERNKAQSPALDASNDGGKVAKRSRNVFYVVLRHGHLMLYDDDHQLEVRHVISLALYDIDVYAGGGEIPEGELWVKRNCIRLQRRNIEPDMHHDPKPYFMFAENCSDKEDFYHALLLNQERTAGVSGGPPRPQPLSSKDVVKLVQLLHASEENIQTRWINALIGRLFLSLYKTAGLKKFVHGKISKKILRVQKPAFITSLQVRNIDMGDCAPLITNPRLKELTLDGDLTVEMDVKYHGNFRLEIAAVARIELGSRFKAREVDLVLAGICKRLDGHLLVRIKPPPSNRIWISFEHMPTLEMSIEPIVSSRQITYGVILRAIESRIREVIADTLVLPNWDDVPFSDTAAQAIRGGIWMDETASPLFSSENLVGTDGAEDDVAKGSVDATPNTNAAASSDDLQEPPTSSRRRRTSPAPLVPDDINISTDTIGSVLTATGSEHSGVKPKPMRSRSFATTASPVVDMDPATVQAIKDHARKGQDAASAMKDINFRSNPTSPFESPVGSLPEDDPSKSFPKTHRPSDSPSEQPPNADQSDLPSYGSDVDPVTHGKAKRSNTSGSSDSPPKSPAPSTSNKRQLIAGAASATIAAKRWGFDLVAKRSAAASKPAPGRSSEGSKDTTPLQSSSSQDSFKPLPGTAKEPRTQPLGRGQPLPPPGTPLPGPPRTGKLGWSTPLAGWAKRKPVPEADSQASKAFSERAAEERSENPHEPEHVLSPPALPPRAVRASSSSADFSPSVPRPVPKPPLPRRRERSSTKASDADKAKDEVLVVKAPEVDMDTDPGTPATAEENLFVTELDDHLKALQAQAVGGLEDHTE